MPILLTWTLIWSLGGGFSAPSSNKIEGFTTYDACVEASNQFFVISPGEHWWQGPKGTRYTRDGYSNIHCIEVK